MKLQSLSPLRFHSALAATLVLLSNALTLATETKGVVHQRFAVLIGVGKYPHLSEREQLDGSANDVSAMRQLLIERFEFSQPQITTLVDAQATGQAIRLAIRELIRSIDALPSGSATAQVVIHFSGHGAQVADQNRDELDGLDETWVPSDAEKQAGDEDIRDDEINQWAREICQGNRAHLLIIADSCHSGTGARGVTKVRHLHRNVKAAEVPAETLITENPLPEGVVFLSACRAREQEPEFQDNDATYGLLTRFIVETLSEERKISGLTYDLLQKAIVAGYQRDPRVMQAPVPQLEGAINVLLNTPILGFGTDVDREPYYSVESAGFGSQVLLRAGKFQDVTVGSIFELYDQPEQVDSLTSRAWLRVTKVSGTTSEAEVFRWKGEDRANSVAYQLPANIKRGFAILRYHQRDHFDLKLKVVRVVDSDRDSAPLSSEDATLGGIVDALATTRRADETDWFQWVTDPWQRCDVLLRLDGNYGALFPATGFPATGFPATGAASASDSTARDVPASLRGGWGPIDLRTGMDDSDPPLSLTDYLRRITRARNLVSLAQSDEVRGTTDYQVDLELLRLDWDHDGQAIRSSALVKADPDGALVMRGMTEDQFYGFRVRNRAPDGKPVYVTVLEVSPNMGIQRVMPLNLRTLKLEASEESGIQPLVWAEPHGLYRAVMLVTRELANFDFVAQAELTTTRGAGILGGGAGRLNNQLQRFTHFRPTQTRGRPVRRKKSDSTWHAQVHSWTTTPPEDEQVK